MSNRNEGFFGGLLGPAIMIGVVVLGPRACTAVVESDYSGDDAVKTVNDNGYSNAILTETNEWYPALQGCGELDNLGYEITAVNEDGKSVDLQVCTGFFKDITIRPRR